MKKTKSKVEEYKKSLPRRVALSFQATRPTNLPPNRFVNKSQTRSKDPPTLLPSLRLSSGQTKCKQGLETSWILLFGCGGLHLQYPRISHQAFLRPDLAGLAVYVELEFTLQTVLLSYLMGRMATRLLEGQTS